MYREKLLRDPIHDLIHFDLDDPGERLLFEILDTREYQRLRRIRQMGLASLVFPGAEHSRFTHSIGVMHLMRQVVTRLDKGRKLDPLVRVAAHAAALLHDIGHGPFSHVMEQFFGMHHEQWSREIILNPDTSIHHLLNGYDSALPELVVSIIDHQAEPIWLSYVLSSQLDVDRFDYLARDSHMTGVKYGIFDLDRLMLMLRIHPESGLVYVARKGLLPVEKYLQSRYHMYRQVYFHKACASAEAMLMAVLRRCRELCRDSDTFRQSLPGGLSRLFSDAAKPKISDYLDLDDSVLLYALSVWQHDQNDPVLADLAARLLNRDLYRSLEVPDHEENDLEFSQRLETLREFMLKQGLDPEYSLLYGHAGDTPYRPYRGAQSSHSLDNRIWIEGDDDPFALEEISECSPTVRAFTDSPWSLHRIYFPLVDEGSWREQIRSILTH